MKGRNEEESWWGGGEQRAARGPEPRARPRRPHSPGIRGELLLKRAATAAARKHRIFGKSRGRRPLQVPRHRLWQQEAGPKLESPPQNVPGSSEELAVAAGTRDWAPGTLSRWLWNARPPRTAPRPPPPGSAPPPASRGPRGRERPAGERKDPGVSDSPSSLVTHSRRGPGQALLPSRGSPLCVVNRGADLNCVFQEPSRLQSTQESLANGFRSGSWTGSLGFVILSAVASLTTGFPSLFHSL